MFTRINLFVGPRHHRPHFGIGGGWFAPMYNPFDRMFKLAMPLMIGNMISNFGLNIAGIISGRGVNNGGNCNCAQNDPYNMLYGNNNYATANTLYPYVNLNNTSQNQETEGKGSAKSNNDNVTIAKMEKAYKKYGIESIYRLDDGRYCAVTKNGNLTGLTLADLADEISDYYGMAKESHAVDASDDAGVDAGEDIVSGADNDEVSGNVQHGEAGVSSGKFSEQFVKTQWHRYLANPKSRADEFKNISLELGKTSKEAHRNNPAEYALNTLINQLGLAGVKYDSDSYKNLLSDFKRMNPSLFNEDGTMKAGYQDKINKLDLPSKATLIKDYHLKEVKNETKLGGKYKTNLSNGKYGYEYANGNKIYSSKSFESGLDTDAVFEIANNKYKLECDTNDLLNNTIDYWNILGQRTTMQSPYLDIIDDKTGKFKTDKEYMNKNGAPYFVFSGDKDSPLNGAKLIKYNNNVYVQLQNGKTYLADEVMAGKYNNTLKL